MSDALRQQYLTLVKTALPAAARSSPEPWPVRLDHCFMRIVLDNLFGQCWYDRLDRRKPAYTQLTEAQLTAAIALAESMLAGGVDRVHALNNRSLALRGKAGPVRRRGDAVPRN